MQTIKPVHLLKNPMLRIYVVNAVHCLKMGLIEESDCKLYIQQIIDQLPSTFADGQAIEEFASADAKAICQKAIPLNANTTGVGKAATFNGGADYCGTVLAYGALKAGYSSLVDMANLEATNTPADYLLSLNQAAGAALPSSKKEGEKEITATINKIKNVSGKVPLLFETNRKTLWIAPDSEEKLTATEFRDKLGLDHLPRDQKLSSRRLVRLLFKTSSMQKHASMWRPTVFDQPSPRFRALTKYERAHDNNLEHGRTAHLETYEDGYQELVAAFDKVGATVIQEWKLDDLGNIKSKHPNARRHKEFAESLDGGISKKRAYQALRNFNLENALATMFQIASTRTYRTT